jgi:hypothetical protein
MRQSEKRDIPPVKLLGLVGFLLCSLLCGCSTGRSYHPRESVWGLGYSETMISQDSWRVMYRGHSIPEAQAADFAMLRAADLMKAAGFPFFLVLSEKSSATTQTIGVLSVQGGAGVGALAATSYPEYNMTVKGLMQRPQDSSQQLFETSFIASQLRSKYRID